MSIPREIDSADQLGEQLEGFVVRKGQFPASDRNILLMGYWSLVFDYHKGILILLQNKFCGSAFALLRPLVEAVIRAHIALIGSDDDIRQIQNDKYNVNFKIVGAQIDAAFSTGNFFENYLNGARGALHSFAHSGLSQLGRRFTGNDLKPSYSEEETIEVIRNATTGVWLVTNLVTKYLKFEDETKAAGELFEEWGKYLNRKP